MMFDGAIYSQEYKSLESYVVTIKISITEYHYLINMGHIVNSAFKVVMFHNVLFFLCFQVDVYEINVECAVYVRKMRFRDNSV